jgi:hypothetical protein
MDIDIRGEDPIHKEREDGVFDEDSNAWRRMRGRRAA